MLTNVCFDIVRLKSLLSEYFIYRLLDIFMLEIN